MKAELTLIPKVVVHPGQISLYNEMNWSPAKPIKTKEYELFEKPEPSYQHLLESARTAEGNVSVIAKRKMNKALNYLLFMASEKTIQGRYPGKDFKFKIAFITLTLPSEQKHTDNEIKSKCLNSLLIELKKFYKVKNYIWRAEKQENGNLHFHIIVDRFVPFQELRDRWNRIVQKLGYVSRYREEQEKWHEKGFTVRQNMLKTWPKEKQRQAYERGSKTHWNSPNSTDIHSIRNIWNVKLYISKYLTKNERNQKDISEETEDLKVQQGRIWSCSSELSNIKGAVSEMDNETETELIKLKDKPGVRNIHEMYYDCLFFDSEVLNQSEFPRLFNLFFRYLFDTFNYSHQSLIFS